jgi:hypothetical protein
MKKILILTGIMSVISIITAAAQSITYLRQTTFPISQSVTLTQAGRLSVIATGNIGYTSGHAPVIRILIDGVIEDSYNLPGVSDGQQDLFGRSYQTNSLPTGAHTVQVAIAGSFATANGATLLVIAQDEPDVAVQTALDQLMADLTTAYQTADTALMQALQNQINAVNQALTNSLTALEAQVSALEQSQTNQDAQIAAHNTRIATLENAVTQLQTMNTQLQEQIDALGSAPSVSRSKYSKNLGTTDYLIMGGMAAGTTGLGVGLYSLFDEPEPTVLEASSGANHSDRPGYPDNQ